MQTTLNNSRVLGRPGRPRGKTTLIQDPMTTTEAIAHLERLLMWERCLTYREKEALLYSSVILRSLEDH
jgi:hypothetical protein